MSDEEFIPEFPEFVEFCKTEETDPLTIEERLNEIEEKLELILENQSKIFEVLSQKRKAELVEYQVFPLNTEEEMLKVNEDIEKQKGKFIERIRGIIQPKGLIKNLDNIISKAIILDYNYDGVNGKKALKDFVFLNEAIYKASAHEGYSHSDYVRDIRTAFRLHKNRYFKSKCIQKKKERLIMAEAGENPFEFDVFPLRTEGCMLKANADIEHHKKDCVNRLKNILQSKGLLKRLESIIDSELIINYNYDGVNGKKPFKELKFLNAAIYEALGRDGYSQSDYVKDIRAAFRLHKNRYFKRKFDLNKREKAIKMEEDDFSWP